MSSATLTMDAAEPSRPAINPWIIALAVTLATFMEVLDTSIANVALPHIAGSLSAGTDESTWVLTSYLVSNAIVLPLSGWISSIIGRKRFYMSCVALFTVSSLLCGLAPNLAMLIFFRVLQGAGGGGLQPSEQAILADTFPPAKRGMAFAVYGIAVVTAPAIGPTLGGWITDNFTWRWIFFINIPVGILSILLTSRLIQDPPYFKLGFALLGSTLLLPLFMQTLLGYTAEQAGVALMPGGFTIMLLLPLVGFLLSRYSPRWLLLFGLTVLSASLFHMTNFDLGIDFRTAAT